MDAEIAALDFTSPNFQSAYGAVLNRIHHEVAAPALKKELVVFAQTIGRQAVAESISPNLVGTEGSIAYCLNRGAKLAPTSLVRLNAALDNVEFASTSKAPDWEPIPESPQSKTMRAYVECYAWIDNAKTRVLGGKLDQRELASTVRKIVNSHASDKMAVLTQLFEHYKESYTDARADVATESWVKPLATIVETIGLLISNINSVKNGARGAKARKINSVLGTIDRKGEKAASKVKYKDSDNDLGLRSVDPSNLVGATAAVVFNTKNRHCEVYVAKPGATLSVQGAKIINFSETLSVGKTIRNPEASLAHWTRASTLKRLEVLVKDIRGKRWEVNGKLNRNTLILKVL